MLIIPTQAVPSQVINIQLAGQNCTINVYQKFYGLFLDLYVNNVLIIGGCICQNLNRIVRSLYLGFIGDLAFIDNQGDSDPYYTGLGTQYSLAYIEASDLPAGVG
jgi:hypothetical protein